VSSHVEGTRLNDLEIKLWTNGQEASLPKDATEKAKCKITYSVLKTPSLQEVFPKSSIGGKEINFMGLHRITDLGDARS